jgi:hypothetical protein
MSTVIPAAEAPQTAEVEIWVQWQGLQGPQERVFYIKLDRPAAILNPTYEESSLLETKFFQRIPIPSRDWVSLAVQYPSQEGFTQVYDRTGRDEYSMRCLRECQDGMWRRAHEFPTARFETPGLLMILTLVIEREAVNAWLQSVPVGRHINLKLPKIIRDEQIKKVLDILDPVHAVLQLPDIADEEDDEQDDAAQQAQQVIQEDYRRAVARVTGVEAEAHGDFGPKLAVCLNLHRDLLGFLHENDAFLSEQPEPSQHPSRPPDPTTG